MPPRFEYKTAASSGRGMWADITVFDPERILDRATFEKPHQYSTGVEYVLVNGELVVERGRHTGARPGRILYGPGRRVTQ